VKVAKLGRKRLFTALYRELKELYLTGSYLLKKGGGKNRRGGREKRKERSRL